MVQHYPPRVRIVDVARAAGVATGTASKALNGSGSLRPETRERVRQAAAQLGFVPDAAARAMSQRRTFTVGLLSTDDVGRFSLPVVLGAENALLGGEISALLATSRKDPVREQHHLRTLLARRVDGIIATGRRTDVRDPLPVPVPVVYAMAPSTSPQDVSITPDDRAGILALVDHLRALGHRRIVHVGGRQEHHTSQVRWAALTEAADNGRIELVGAPLFGAWSEAWGRQAVDLVLRTDPELKGVDTIMFASDQLARAGSDRLRERGLDVPGQVAVTGYDNWDVMAMASRPPLTTVDMHLELVGATAAQRLLALITDGPQAVRAGVEHVPPRLVIRQSTVAAQ